MFLFPPPGWTQQPARVYVYAPHETQARSWKPVWCDGVVVAKLRRGTFFAMDVGAGQHVLSLKEGPPFMVEAKAGDPVFVRLDQQMEVGQRAVSVFSKAPPEVAKQEMRFVMYVDAKQVLSKSVASTDPREIAKPQLKTR